MSAMWPAIAWSWGFGCRWAITGKPASLRIQPAWLMWI
jgi:hypothetical protein